MSTAAAAHAPGTVTEEILSGGGLSLSQAARLIPSSRQNRPTNHATIWRWAMDGVRLADGSVVRLEAVRLAGRWLTSRQAVGRFIDRQTPDLAAEAVPAPRPPSQRRRSSEAADAELKRRGC